MKIYEIQHPTIVIASLSFEEMLLLCSTLCNALLVMTQRANTHQTDKMSHQYTLHLDVSICTWLQVLAGINFNFLLVAMFK